ncbi:SusC/RagA family TonB-linked outer membrane protein [Chryseolinea lacunae]|uniref:SusC/RagA family TonB-linked outer membrane protein n=1 Tax=Chryseolinea lacunae TaxID=2801331 RepID=A0ABS1L0G9_9BACT|nr:SusC/RagA family TonB-linked outer membrane protein [Chryseolinea lacunae]MBL0745199.1 SusC/RagA family TonB-linked outer membrane protein [Chryseolinea lacunae]
MKRILLFCCLTLITSLISGAVWAQDRTVTGKVTSTEDGTSLPGVNVVLSGTAVGTVSDAEGNFKLSVPATGGTLVFSFIGLTTQEVAVGDRTVIDIQMAPDAKQLAEVVVTGAGIEKDKRTLGYRLESVSGTKLQQVSEGDPLRALQGKVAGVNIISSSGAPGSSTRITMRGNRSMLGNNQPLIVVDGIPYDNQQVNTSNQLSGGGSYASGLAGVDPNNIETMNILPPGGAGAALYGVRAANGVIVITTKTGTSRASKKGLEMSVTSGYSVEEISGLPDFQNKYGSGSKFNYSPANGSWGAPFPGAVDYPTISTIPRWQPFVDAYPNEPKTVPYQAHPNNVKDFFNTGSLWENSLTMNGGNEKANFSATLSRLDQKGIVPNSKFQRNVLSIGANTILANNIHIGGTMSYSSTVQAGPPGGAGNAIGNGTAFGRTMYLGRDWDLQGQPYEDPITKESLFFVAKSQSTNPYWSAKYDGIQTQMNRIVTNFNVAYDINDWLSVQYRGGVTHYDQSNKEWFRPGGRAAGGIGQITTDYTTWTEIESFLRVNATKKLTDDLTLGAYVAHNLNQRTQEQQSYIGTGMIDFNILDIDNTTSVLNNGGIYSRRRLIGVLGEVSLQYRDYLTLTATGRNDWSSTLPVSKRSFFYPSISSAFIFTDAFNMDKSILSFGKLRATWSKTGNDASPYDLSNTYMVNPQFVSQSVQFPFNKIPGTTLGGLPGSSDVVADPNLTPEFTRSVEVGTDLQFFDNRASIGFTYYNTLTTNGIAAQSYPSVSGYTSYLTNFGDVSNKGIEIMVGITPVSLANGFRWDINANFTHNRNVVERLAPGVDEIVVRNLFAGGITPVLRPGQEYGIMRGSVDVRDHDGNLLIDPSNGQLIRSLSPAIIGNPNPDFKAGMTNTFSYKGVSLSVLFDWTQGGDLYSTTVSNQLGRGVTKDTEDREVNKIIPGFLGDINSGQPLLDAEGKKIPNNIQIETNDLYFGETFGINAADEWNVYDATVFRLREASLGYSLPKSLLAKTPFGSVSVTLTGRNLWYKAPNMPKHSHMDPETSSFGTSNAQGFEFDNFPSVRRYGVNLRLTF